MQKFLALLEKNVQWFALGLGTILLLWTLYTYVLQPPVFVVQRGQTLTAAEIDPATVKGPVMDLRHDIDRKPDDTLQKMQAPNYVDSFENVIKNPGLPKLVRLPMPSSVSGVNVIRDIPGGAAEGIVVTELPSIPRPELDQTQTGRSTVQLPNPNAQPQPGNVKVELPTEDRDWVRQTAKIPMAKLLNEFNKTFNTPKVREKGINLMQTAVLQVELIRQERLPNGEPGQEEVVPGLQITPKKPFPPANAPPEDVLNYLDWANKNNADITNPGFYQVIEGDQPGKAPIQKPRPVVNTPPPPPAETPHPRPRPPAKPAKKYAPQDAQRPANGLMPTAGPGLPAPPGGSIFGGTTPGTGADKGPARFDVAQAGQAQPIDVVAYDDSVKPGHTYRYKMRYKLLNPLYQTVNLAPPNLSGQFALVSQDSTWSDWVTVTPRVTFFVASTFSDTVRFDVFTWERGRLVRKPFSARAGDTIADTSWILVDQRKDIRNNEDYILLVNQETGITERRDIAADRRNPQYQQMQKEAVADSGGSAPTAQAFR